MYACICTCMNGHVHDCMGVWIFSSMYMCVHVCVHVCVYTHAGMYILLYPTPPSIEVGLPGFSPPPRPPPKKKKKYWKPSYASPMTTLLTYAGRDLFFLSYQIKAINRWLHLFVYLSVRQGNVLLHSSAALFIRYYIKTRFKLHLNQHNLAASVQNAKVLIQALNVHIGSRLHLGMTNGFCTCL